MENRIKVVYSKQYLERKFKDYNTDELIDILDDFKKNNGLSADDKILKNMIQAELERRNNR